MATREKLEALTGKDVSRTALEFPLASLLIRRGFLSEQEWIDELYRSEKETRSAESRERAAESQAAAEPK